MFGVKTEKTAQAKTRAEQFRDGDRELLAREESRLSGAVYLLELAKNPPDGSRPYYEILRQREDTLAVLVKHDRIEFGTAEILYGTGNVDFDNGGFYRPYRVDGQLAAMRRITRGIAAAADLAIAAAAVAKNALVFGDGAMSSADRRIQMVDDFAGGMVRNLESLEIEQVRLGRARFDAQRLRDAPPPPPDPEIEARKVAAAKKFREESEANMAAIRAMQAERLEAQKRAAEEWRAAQAIREAEERAEQVEREAWLAERARQQAEAEQLLRDGV